MSKIGGGYGGVTPPQKWTFFGNGIKMVYKIGEKITAGYSGGMLCVVFRSTVSHIAVCAVKKSQDDNYEQICKMRL